MNECIKNKHKVLKNIKPYFMNKEINNMLETRLKETKRTTGTKRSLERMKLALYIQALPPAGQRMEPRQPQVFRSAQESCEATWPWLSWMGGKMVPLVPYKGIPSPLWVLFKVLHSFPL